MSVKFQALLGNTIIDADSIQVDELVAEKGIIANLDVTKDLRVDGVTELNEVEAVDVTIEKLTVTTSFILPAGSGEGKVLTSNAIGTASWRDSVLGGDITGPASANVQHHKWIGN